MRQRARPSITGRHQDLRDRTGTRRIEVEVGGAIMKQMIIAVSLLLLAGVGCDKEQDRQLPDGTKIFGERTFNDGSLREIVRVELPNGKKKFNVTLLADGTEKAERVEYPDGDKWFDV